MARTKQQTGRAGESFVVGEIHRRGGYATAFAGNMPRFDVIATDSSQSRMVLIQIKSTGSDSWVVDPRLGCKRSEDPADNRFWVFVGFREEHPTYHVVPEWWIQNDMFERRQGYVARLPPGAKEGGIQTVTPQQIREWLDRWGVLEIF